MNYSVGQAGRVVTARLEEGDGVYESIKKLCGNEKISRAVFWIIGGSQNVSMVTGPKDPAARPLHACVQKRAGISELLGTGTVFPDEDGVPSVHMHASLGNQTSTATGCPRISLDCWLINELILMELTDSAGHRERTSSGYHLLTLPDTQ
ncbi:MAG: PPC domain-containing DNA-binding protein [Fibrobacterota bacterium]